MSTQLTRIKLAWLAHAGKLARRGNVRGYTAALQILNDLEGPLLSKIAKGDRV